MLSCGKPDNVSSVGVMWLLGAKLMVVRRSIEKFVGGLIRVKACIVSAHVVPLRKGDDRGATIADDGSWNPLAVPFVDQVVKVSGQGERERSSYTGVLLMISVFAPGGGAKKNRYY